MKHVLMVGRSLEMLTKGVKHGVRYSLLCKNAPRVGIEDLGSFSRIVMLDPGAGVEEWIAHARLIQQRDPVDAIGGFTEDEEAISAEIASALGLHYHSADVVANTHDKFRMRQTLRAAGVDDTVSCLLPSADGERIRAFAADHGYPVVLKPVDGGGSLGVSIARNEHELDTAIRWFERWASKHALLVESYLEGDEWSVEAFSEAGVHRVMCITRKYKDPKTCVETGHCLPVLLEPEATRAIHDLVGSTLTTLGILDGPTHTELITTPRGPRVVETHTRMGGDLIGKLIRLVTGIDPHELWWRQTLGQSVIDEVPICGDGKHAAIRYVSPHAFGVLERVEGVEEARACPGVEDLGVLKKPGAVLGEVFDSSSRAAAVIATGETPDQAMDRATEATKAFRFVVSCAA
ncbi:ATP-grasp domain-containing protein [Lysobacter brunescens]|uniref:ATP-grasp domain-containing protein n=1 Tax=Lysobacter brunescens TaxID=262323 RepID=A0ABW2YEW6_9GAMM